MTKSRKFLFLVGGAALLVSAWLLADTLIVKVRTTNLKKEPKFFAADVAVLNNGEAVEKLGQSGAWFQVKTARGAEGWVHTSAVQVKKFSLLASDREVRSGASAQEVALAGKGFNKQVEDSFRSRRGDISFEWVEKMLQIKVDTREIVDFLKTGRLAEFGGPR